MKKSIVGALMAAFVMCGVPCLAAETQQPCPAETDYQVPEGKKERWQALKGAAFTELAVCNEHCGDNKKCLDKCKEVYQHRLDKQYQELLHQQ